MAVRDLGEDEDFQGVEELVSGVEGSLEIGSDGDEAVVLQQDGLVLGVRTSATARLSLTDRAGR